MKVNCLSCGHKVDLDDAYDDYDGQIKCFSCHSVLEIKTQQGNVKSVTFVKPLPRSSSQEAVENSG